MWKQAVEKAASTEVDKVREAMIGQKFKAPSGFELEMDGNHHLHKPVLIGEIQDDGQFEVVYETPGLVLGDEWSDFLPESQPLISDWRAPMSCGNFNTATGKCGGAGAVAAN